MQYSNGTMKGGNIANDRRFYAKPTERDVSEESVLSLDVFVDMI